MTLNHLLSASSHSNSQDDNQRGGNHRKTSGHSVNDDFLGARPVIGSKDDDGANEGGTEEQESELGELTLERSSDVDTKEAADSVGEGENPGLHPARERRRTILATLLGLTTTGLLTTESNSNLTNLSVVTSSENNTLGTTLGDS